MARPRKTSTPSTAGRKTRFVGATVQVSLKLTPDTTALLQQVQAAQTKADGYPCSLANAVAWCAYKATGTALPTGNLDRPSIRGRVAAARTAAERTAARA
jgi:hypothetical protein